AALLTPPPPNLARSGCCPGPARPPSDGLPHPVQRDRDPRHLHSFPTRRSSDLPWAILVSEVMSQQTPVARVAPRCDAGDGGLLRSEEHTSELQSRFDLVCRLLLEKKKTHEGTRPSLRRVCV